MRKCNKQRNVVRAILAWYRRHGRTLPWRDISNPYRILVSEIMLQQTQVRRVLEKYPLFLRRFPTLRSLAGATRRDVILAWQGMGYNNRAVHLHECARALINNYKGKIPNQREELLKLPGIGTYTANALLCSVHALPVPVVDVNVQRVLSRLFWTMPTTGSVRSAGEIAALSQTLIPKRRAYDWNQALMDLGATVCIARSPRCGECPVANRCASRTRMLRLATPRVNGKAQAPNTLPNRIYRGKIIEQLRNTNGTHRVRADVLARSVRPAFARGQKRWFKELLTRLERDGLISVSGGGALAATYVSLA